MKKTYRCPQWLFWLLAAVVQLLLAAVMLLMLSGNAKPKWEWSNAYATLPIAKSPEIRISNFVPASWAGYYRLNDAVVADAMQAISINFYLAYRSGDGKAMTYEVVTDTADLFSYRLYDSGNTDASWTVMVSMSGDSVPLVAVDKGGSAQ